MNRRFFVTLMVLGSLLGPGCSKDDEITAFAAELEAVSTEIVSKVEGSQDPSAGVDDAQRYFDSRKPGLEARYKELESVRGFQVKDETMARMMETVTRSATKVATLQLKYVERSVTDKAFGAKLEKLTRDYQSIFD